MKILAIRGKNIASLDTFEIDFEKGRLASASLYAITGPTGSGKSALLDSMCLALYNNTPRLASAPSRKDRGVPEAGTVILTQQDPRTLLRRGAVEALAEVDFVAGDGKRYRASWSVKRANEKTDGALQKVQRTVQRLGDATVVASGIEESGLFIPKLTGLTFEQFTRSVLLAQNEFASFLRADDDDRSKLLQTLTGSQIFERISMRAFERFSDEKRELERLERDREGSLPLDPADRQALESELSELDAELSRLEEVEKTLAQFLQWFVKQAELIAAHQKAAAELERARSEMEAAEPRRRQLGRTEKAQAARHLVLEEDRCRKEESDLSQDVQDAARQERQAWEADTHASQDVEKARERLATVRVLVEDLKPRIQKARTLDARISGLLSQHEREKKNLDKAKEAFSLAEQALDANRRATGDTKGALDADTRWLKENGQFSLLSEKWVLVDSLLDQASDLLGEAGGLERQLRGKQGQRPDLAKRVDDAHERCRIAEEALQAATGEFLDAEEAAAAFDLLKIAERRDFLAARKDTLTGAASLWREVEDLRVKLAARGQQSQDLQLRLKGYRSEISRAESRLPGAESAYQKALDLWRRVDEACHETAESLRATLEPGNPCPVCGATEHPYIGLSGSTEKLRSALRELERDRDARKAELEAIEEAVRVDLSLARTAEAELEKLERERHDLDEKRAASEALWKGHPVALESAGVPEVVLAEWMESQQSTVETESMGVRAEERRALECQADLEKARASRQARSEEAEAEKARKIAVETALAELDRELSQLAGREEDATRKLTSLLDKLDESGLRAACGENWPTPWKADPPSFKAGRAKENRLWKEKSTSVEGGQRSLDELSRRRTDLEAALGERTSARETARKAFSEIDDQLSGATTERASLFQGTEFETLDTDRIDEELSRRTSEAEERHEELRKTAEGIAQDLIVKRARRAQKEQAHEAAREKLRSAAEALEDWILGFNAARDAGDLPLEEPELRQLLKHDASWMDSERAFLNGLANTVGNAQGALSERANDRESHEATRPTDESRESLETRRQQTAEERKGKAGRKAQLELQIREDDGRKAKVAGMEAEIDVRRRRVAVLESVSQLIGSKDGKRFRVLAQQMTLDVLLSYANEHLKTLAPRYRLERVGETLGLQVVDQELGDGVRGVHSLSGGESFLTSLALALGLASLSSEKVRVESLFIDEGFGSLDEKTLSMAMDALARLHAHGRKVGVISHLAEQTSQIPVRIEVKKMRGGWSRVVVPEK